jgi:hypothetical protein
MTSAVVMIDSEARKTVEPVDAAPGALPHYATESPRAAIPPHRGQSFAGNAARPELTNNRDRQQSIECMQRLYAKNL